MTIRSNGSYIGPRPAGPSTSVASGIWDLRTAQRQKSANLWTGDPVDEYFSNVSLLLHMDGSNGSTTFTDSSGSPKAATAGGATITTAQSKFGGASGNFSVSSADQYISFNHDDGFSFSSGDSFCIELWYYPTAFTTYNYLASKGDYGGGSVREWAVGVTSSGVIFYHYPGSVDNVYSASATVSLNTWTHLVWACNGSTVRIYKDGQFIGSTSFSTPSGVGQNKKLWIGKFLQYTGISHYAPGYIDDLRITKGSDRGYTGSTITVQTAAFPDA